MKSASCILRHSTGRGLLLAAALLSPALLHAQTGGLPATCITLKNCYVVYKETALVAGTEKITLQAGTASTSLNLHLIDGEVYCDGAADITLTQNGTAATTTTLAVTAVNGSPAATGAAFSSSNSSGGNTLDKVSIPTGGGTFHWDLTFLIAYGGSGTQNISISTSSVTATCRIKIIYSESVN